MLLLCFLLLIYIYSITFVFIPVSAKILLEIVCLFVCMRYITNPRFCLKKEYYDIVVSLLLLGFWDLIVSTLNGGSEYHLAKRGFIAIGSLFASQCIYELSIRAKVIDRKRFLRLIVIVIFSESVLSLLMKVFPFILTALQSILVFDFGGFGPENMIFEMGRFHGIGTAMYYGVLPSAMLGLMATMYLLVNSNTFKTKISYIFIWCIIFAVSFLTARFTIFIGALSIVYYLYASGRRSLAQNIVLLALMGLFFFCAYKILLDNATKRLLEWAFGEFSGDKGGTASVLYDLWLNTRFTLKTLLIGDAKYNIADGVYYMNTDIGIFRQIYYGGLIGLFLDLKVHYKIFRVGVANEKDSSYKAMFFSLLLGYIVLLMKGDASLMSLFLLFSVFNTKGIYCRKNIACEQLKLNPVKNG